METDKSKRAGKAFIDAAQREGWTPQLRKLERKLQSYGQIIQTLSADAEVEFEDMVAAWEERYGEPYPRDVEDWKKLAALAGMKGQTIHEGQWTQGDVAPIIEGYLQREANERNRVAKKRRSKGGQGERKRGNAKDQTTQLDQGCQYIINNPSEYDISPSDLAKIVQCSKSVFSSPKGKVELAKARSTAKRTLGQIRRGFGTDDHQADAVIDEDWQTQIDDSIDAR